MEEVRKIDKRDGLRVVTANGMIDAEDLSSLSLNARKLFYVAISQCKMEDKEFYEYEASPSELAELFGISRQEVYMVTDKITTELMKIVITLRTGKKAFKKRHLFEKCNYSDDKVLYFQLHKDLTDLLLGLKKNFSKPLVWDFVKMRSPYSMAIWHLMQREMHSFKPMMSSPIIFELSLEELRQVTGTENKFRQVGEFKRFVLDKALREIRKNCWVDITYTNIKQGRKVVGFSFTAQNVMGTIRIDDLSYREQQRVRRAQLVRKRADGAITAEETAELLELCLELDQYSISDYDENGNLAVASNGEDTE